MDDVEIKIRDEALALCAKEKTPRGEEIKTPDKEITPAANAMAALDEVFEPRKKES